MAGRFFGTLTREVGGKTWRLVLDFNAICYFEAATGRNFFAAAEEWQKRGGVPSSVELRALIHASLQEHHPDATVKDAGSLLSQELSLFGDIMAASQAGVEPAAEGKKSAAAA